MTDWQRWLDSWDRQQEHLLPDREERIGAMEDVVEAVVGPPQRVLDLAGGPGSISVRLLRRFPGAQVVLVDVDPSLLAIASGVLADERRMHILQADLADMQWAQALPTGQFDAVVTANSLHWLDEPALRRVYADLSRLIREGGVFCNVDPMPSPGADRLTAMLDTWVDRRRRLPVGTLDWGGWWKAAAADGTLAPLVAERNKRFGGETHPPDFTPPVEWHLDRLREAGFAEAACVWRHGNHAMVAGLR